MWDTMDRIPFEASLLSDRDDTATRNRLLALIAGRPGITVDELHALHFPGLFADLRSFHRRDSSTRTRPRPGSSSARPACTRYRPNPDPAGSAAAQPIVSVPSAARVQPGLYATSQTWPSGSAKYPE